MAELSEINKLRMERDEYKNQNIILRRENERLRMLLGYAEDAIMGEYQLRKAHKPGKPSEKPHE